MVQIVDQRNIIFWQQISIFQKNSTSKLVRSNILANETYFQ